MVDKKTYIEVCAASLGYLKGGKKVPVLKNIDLKFYGGELVGIVGLNGVGKSTLLKSIAGLLPLLAGEIKIVGESIQKIGQAELSRKISIVLTEKIGGFNLRVFDVVASGQMPYTNAFHVLREENKKIVEEAILRCGINDYKNYPVNELSDGLFQKTIIAKALAQQTPAMLLDEPSAFLDYASKHALFLLLKELSEKEDKCILVSSHDLDMMLKYCHKLLVISGKETALINVSEAMENKAFLEIGGGFL